MSMPESAAMRHLRQIDSQKYPKDLVGNISALNHSVDTLAQFQMVMQKGIDDANKDIIQKIQDFIEEMIILFTGGADALDFDWGDLGIIIQNIGKILGFGSFFNGELNLIEWAADFFDVVIGDNVIGAIWDGINEFIADLLQAISGATGGMVDLTGWLNGVKGDVVTLQDVAITEVTTGLSGASGPYDVMTFPRMMMVPDQDGNHPAYTPGKRVIDFYFIRIDRPADYSRFKVIMGGETAWFDIDDARLGLYKVNPDGTMNRVWMSGNLDAVLGGQRKEYSVSMGQVFHFEQGQVLALAQLQIAPGLAQTPRQISCLYKTPFEDAPGAFPGITGGYISNQSTMPLNTSISSLVRDDGKIGWMAIAP